MDHNKMVDRFRMPEFLAPLPLGAVALMAVNDRVLKARFHNGITGKLSDVAICFFLPLFCSALFGLAWRAHRRVRLVAGAALAAFVFTAQELWPAFQAVLLTSLRWIGQPLGLGGFVLTSDASDLWALLLVPLAVAYGWGRDPPITATSASDCGRAQSPQP